MTQSDPLRYVLITPARNESKYIENTIHTVARQTHLPVRWVIVNDGLTDNTGIIVARYAAQYDWIQVVNRPRRQTRDFAAKVHAFRAGQEQLAGIDYDIIGNLDGDVTLDPDHFAFLMSRFAEDPDLGVAGTTFREEDGYNSATDSFEGQNYVSGQCQIFRRECFEMIGGYLPSKAGGIDWIAVTTARMLGWKTRSFREKPFFHHRPLGTATHGPVRKSFDYGRKDYYLGGHPIWQTIRSAYQIFKRPYIIGGLGIFAGFFTGYFSGKPRVVSPELMRFHRREQMVKLRAILRSLIQLKKIDNFGLLPVMQANRQQRSPHNSSPAATSPGTIS
ncbi:MAG TPA: glycosyltransferase family 2 protein [Acidobacteriaceae bacterium]|nr:glycosyltransferase family 2 protein [Acidobacteriaceae bacterium]